MATTGTKLQVSHVVNTSGAVVGQGAQPEAWVLYSTDDALVPNPTWNDATAYLKGEGRGFTTSRGRESELQDMDAGTATLTLDNRTRTFDPVQNTAIGPFNRWWIREQFTGETQDIFKGYAESYDQQWPAPVGDATTTVHCVDEFKVLALDRLPNFNPPRDTYADVVKFDNPTAYWRFSDVSLNAEVGGPFAGTGEFGSSPFSIIDENPIVGDSNSGALRLASTQFVGADRENGQTNGNVFSVEYWVRTNTAVPAATRIHIWGPQSVTAPNRNFRMVHFSDGKVYFGVWTTTPSFFQVASNPLVANQWHHIVGTCAASTIRIYVNGVEIASTSITGTVEPGVASFLYLGDSTSAETVDYDEVAIYRGQTLAQARIAAHYQAGTQRGFLADSTSIRISQVLDAAGSQAPRTVDPINARSIQARFMTGQAPLDELRVTTKAESVDALLFIARTGTIVYLAALHRSSPPYDTVQATFDDDGTDLPYVDLDVDYSEAFLANEWNVTRAGGLTQTASDATSIAKYFKRSQSLTDVYVQSDVQAGFIATGMLAKYKDPITRITGITLTTDDPIVAEAIFRRDIGDRIRIFRTPPGGGTRIDQTSFIQKIEIAANAGNPVWTVRWGVSPL